MQYLKSIGGKSIFGWFIEASLNYDALSGKVKFFGKVNSWLELMSPLLAISENLVRESSTQILKEEIRKKKSIASRREVILLIWS